MKVNVQWVPCVRNSSYSFTVHANSFKTLHVLLAWSKDMHVVWLFGLFLPLFTICTQSFFFSSISVNGYRVPCVRNSSYSLIPILLKPYGHCDLAVYVRKWFGYNLQIVFVTIFAIYHYRHFDNESNWTVGTLCAQLLLQFHANCKCVMGMV